ncbi:MAG: metallophosphoesterase family protein, partial [Alphaproteobacteria bacterium]
MVRFIHSADWQIGRAFASVEGDAAARLRQARTDVIDSIGQIAVNEQAAFVLVAGDVFDAEMLANTTLLAPLERMRRFPDVTWHLLPGNHDPDRRE